MKHMSVYKPIYKPKSSPMNVIIFASGGGGNLKAAIDLSIKEPKLVKVGLIVTDRLGIPAIDIAYKFKIPILSYDFEEECGVWAKCKSDPIKAKQYALRAVRFHNKVLENIIAIEKKNQCSFDLAVLSYHRWIHGKLFDYFKERMINQHSGDLTVIKKNTSTVRKYIGINPVLLALKKGESKTRTSTFLVRKGHDSGEILCQGPWIKYKGAIPVTRESAWKHELIQKEKSDWPSLTFALREIALGNFGITNDMYIDGCKILVYKEKMISYGGVNLSKIKI